MSKRKAIYSNRAKKLVEQDAVFYRKGRNAIWVAFQNQFRRMFEPYAGVANAEYQADWYVSERWNPSGVSTFIEESPEERLTQFLSEPLDLHLTARRLRLICGWTGSGKTTFIRHYFKEYLPKENTLLNSKIIPIIIDVNNSAIDPEDLEEDIDHSIDIMLRNDYSYLNDLPHCIDMWKNEIDWENDFYRELWKGKTSDYIRTEKIKYIYRRRNERIQGRKHDNAYSDFNRVRLNYLSERFGKWIVVVWDNIDHARLEVQRTAIRLAHHKLTWIPKMKVIIPVRDYTRSRIETELESGAFVISDQFLLPPQTHTVLLRRQVAVEKAFAEVSTPTVEVGPINVSIRDGSRFLASVLSSFKERETERVLVHLSNGNLRQQLDMVSKVLKSWHLVSSEEVLEALRRHFEMSQAPFLISWRQILEALICGDYRFMFSGYSSVMNVFDTKICDGFINTLNCPYVLQIITKTPGGIPPNQITDMLEMLGHPKHVTLDTLQNLLLRGFITSHEGILLQKDGIHLLRPNIGAYYYVDELMGKLIYLQHMGLIIPLEPQFHRLLRLWEPEEFKERIRGAAVLVDQIAKDEGSQWAYAKSHGSESVDVLDRYRLGRLSGYLRRGVRREVESIRGSNPEGIHMSPEDWDEIIGWFS